MKYPCRGIDLDQLIDLNNQDLVDLFRARQRRKLSRGIKYKIIMFLEKLRKSNRETAYSEKLEAVKTHLRNMVIVPEMIGSVVAVYNRKQYINVEIKPGKIDYLEEIYEAQVEMKKVTMNRKEENKDFEVIIAEHEMSQQHSFGMMAQSLNDAIAQAEAEAV